MKFSEEKVGGMRSKGNEQWNKGFKEHVRGVIANMIKNIRTKKKNRSTEEDQKQRKRQMKDGQVGYCSCDSEKTGKSFGKTLKAKKKILVREEE